MIELKAKKLKGAIAKGMKAFKGCKGKIVSYSDEVVCAGLNLTPYVGKNAILEIYGFTDGALWLEVTLGAPSAKKDYEFNEIDVLRSFFHQNGNQYRHCNYLSKEKDAVVLLQYYAEMTKSSGFVKQVKGR